MAEQVTLQSVIDTHEQPFVVIDREGLVVAVNRAWEQGFGYGRDEVLGQSCCEIYYREDNESAESERQFHADVLRTLTPAVRLFTHRSAAGRPVNVRVRSYPLTDASGELFVGQVILPLSVNSSADVEYPEMVIGKSPAFLEVVSQLQRVAATEAPVLLEGETGTGKELAARFVHEHSQRSAEAFIIVDCTVLGEDLFESELFGHERGAFTGSTATKKGLFELANGGTLFLDEIGEMPLGMQSKLLRALEAGTFRRVGGTQTLRSDVRLVSATNRSLADLVKEGRFRQDLFYRIAVFTTALPPLRERLGDLAAIGRALLERISARAGQEYSITPDAVRRLAAHGFPGNIRELRNILQLAAALCQGNRIDSGDIHFSGAMQAGLVEEIDSVEEHDEDSIEQTLQDVEADYVAKLLEQHQGRRADVARTLGISERTLYRKLRRYGLN